MPRQEPHLYLTASAPVFPPATAWLPPLRLQTGPRCWPLALLLSLVLHGLLGWWGVPSPLTPASVKEKLRTTRISFQHEQPPPVAQPLPLPPPPIASTPKPMVKPPTKPVSSKPTVKPPPPRPVPVKAARPTPKPKPTTTEPTPAAPVAAQAVPTPPPTAYPNPPERIRQDYLTRLITHLEAHKFYPGAARRRGLEGTVQISFTIMNNGEIKQLQLTGGHKMLHQAATTTVQRALPLPSPPREVGGAPLTVSYEMSFALR